jgi:hypothetical protein
MRHPIKYVVLLTFAASLLLAPVAHATTWTVKSVPIEEKWLEGALEGISCAASNHCLAVGKAGTEKWAAAANAWGTEWNTFPLNAQPGTKNGDLRSVSCWAQENCVAAGSYGTEEGGKGVGKSLVEEYESKVEGKLRKVTSPNPSNGRNAEFYGISCPEKEACLAVGKFLNTGGGGEKGAAFAAEGTPGSKEGEATWSQLSPIENPGGQKNGQLLSVSCLKAGECIAVGGWGKEEGGKGVSQAGSESWNKSKKEWKAVAAPEPAGAKFAMFYGVSCKSATFCMAVGKWSENVSTPPYQTFADTWNGSAWTNVLYKGGSKEATEGALYGISCIAVEECEMVGSDRSKAGEEEALVYRWKKGEWTYQATEKPAGSTSWRLEGISCTAAEACNAVGSYNNSEGELKPFGELY